jgi:hypothetical protein
MKDEAGSKKLEARDSNPKSEKNLIERTGILKLCL